MTGKTFSGFCLGIGILVKGENVNAATAALLNMHRTGSVTCFAGILRLGALYRFFKMYGFRITLILCFMALLAGFSAYKTLFGSLVRGIRCIGDRQGDGEQYQA